MKTDHVTEVRVFNGPKPMKPAPVKVARDTVLLVRRLREWSGWRPREIASSVGLSVDYVHQVCEWQIRADIDPGPRPLPTSPAWAEWTNTVHRLTR